VNIDRFGALRLISAFLVILNPSSCDDFPVRLLVKNGPLGIRKHRKMIMLFIVTLTDLVVQFPKERESMWVSPFGGL